MTISEPSSTTLKWLLVIAITFLGSVALAVTDDGDPETEQITKAYVAHLNVYYPRLSLKTIGHTSKRLLVELEELEDILHQTSGKRTVPHFHEIVCSAPECGGGCGNAVCQF